MGAGGVYVVYRVGDSAPELHGPWQDGGEETKHQWFVNPIKADAEAIGQPIGCTVLDGAGTRYLTRSPGRCGWASSGV
jgi:hypothetical protein